LKKGWKTYWKSPGAGGFPQEIDFSNSKNINNIEVFWPTPEQFEILGLKSLGYSENVVFPLKIEIADKSKPIELNARVHFLVCKEICVPGDANLNLVVPNLTNAETTEHANLIEKFVSLSPLDKVLRKGFEIQSAQLVQSDQDTLLKINFIQQEKFQNPKIFVSGDQGLPVVKANINLNSQGNEIKAEFFYRNTIIDPAKTRFLVHFSDFPFVVEKSISPEVSKHLINIFSGHNLLNIVLLSILGGLILNAMPCVLPVLSLKILSAMKYSGQELPAVRKGFIYTSLGIVFSYVFLSLTLLAIRYAGYQIGWGIQFQQPYFLMFISLILLMFSINMLGYYEISLPFISGKISRIIPRNDNFFSDFFIGFFATLMATPCSAPFVGTAIAFAFTQSNLTMISIFAFMGFGMALPYICIALFPAAVRIMPTSGSWMLWVKRTMAILLIATLLWIGSLLSNHFNEVFIILSSLLAIFIFIIFVLNFRKIINKRKLYIGVVVPLLTFFLLPLIGNFKSKLELIDDKWIKYSREDFDEILNKNDLVFVDVTADWCVTCQFNKQNVIYSDEIQKLFLDNEVLMVQADWTLPDDDVRDFLNENNKFGIPFNIFYGEKRPEGLVLPELLTKSSIRETLNKLINK